MSNAVLNWAWGCRLPPRPKFVLVALADRADEAGLCWPGLSDICSRTGMSRRRVLAALHELEAAGAVQIRTGGPRQSNRYVLGIGREIDTRAECGRTAAVPVRNRCGSCASPGTLKNPPCNPHSDSLKTIGGAFANAPQTEGQDEQTVIDWPTQAMIEWARRRGIDPDEPTGIILSETPPPADVAEARRLARRWYALAQRCRPAMARR